MSWILFLATQALAGTVLHHEDFDTPRLGRCAPQWTDACEPGWSALGADDGLAHCPLDDDGGVRLTAEPHASNGLARTVPLAGLTQDGLSVRAKGILVDGSVALTMELTWLDPTGRAIDAVDHTIRRDGTQPISLALRAAPPPDATDVQVRLGARTRSAGQFWLDAVTVFEDSPPDAGSPNRPRSCQDVADCDCRDPDICVGSGVRCDPPSTRKANCVGFEVGNGCVVAIACHCDGDEPEGSDSVALGASCGE